MCVLTADRNLPNGRQVSVVRTVEYVCRGSGTQGNARSQACGTRYRIGAFKPQRLHEITSGEEQRIDMGDDELNRVLGGGLVEARLR